MLFETTRLRLRPIALHDAPFIYKLMNMEAWIKYIGDRKIYSEAMAKKYIQERMLPQFERLGYGNFVVELNETNQIIGSCGLYDREGLEGVDIGFAFLGEFEGKGYAYESASKMLDLGFNQFNLNSIHAITTSDNLPSQQLIKKLGLQYQALVHILDDPTPVQLYTIQKNAYLISADNQSI